MSYAGDSVAKKVVRATVYEQIRRLQPEAKRGCSTVFGLAGDDAADIGPIRAFGVTDSPDKVMLADIEPGGLRAAEAKWPGVRTFGGWAHEAPIPWPIDIAMLDLCGHVERPESLLLFKKLGRHLRVGSMLAVTIQRGREKQNSLTLDLVNTIRDEGFGRRFGDPAVSVMGRSVATLAILSKALGLPIAWKGSRLGQKDCAPVLHLWATHAYCGHMVPMMVVILGVAKLYSVRRNEGVWGVKTDQANAIGTASRMELLRYADSLQARGVDASLALNLSPRVLAAWRAHRSMGTYGEAVA